MLLLVYGERLLESAKIHPDLHELAASVPLELADQVAVRDRAGGTVTPARAGADPTESGGEAGPRVREETAHADGRASKSPYQASDDVGGARHVFSTSESLIEA